jgi:hypothetical protein
MNRKYFLASYVLCHSRKANFTISSPSRSNRVASSSPTSPATQAPPTACSLTCHGREDLATVSELLWKVRRRSWWSLPSPECYVATPIALAPVPAAGASREPVPCLRCYPYGLCSYPASLPPGGAHEAGLVSLSAAPS